jgi:hypothetical protein
VWFLQEPHGVTSQKTPFFKVTAVKTSNLTCKFVLGLKEPRLLRNRSCNSNWNEKRQLRPPKKQREWQRKKQPGRKNMSGNIFIPRQLNEYD